MHTLVRFLIPLLLLSCFQLPAQEEAYEKRIKELKEQRELVVRQEKEALKEAITKIEAQLEAGKITEEEASRLKEEEAERRALNIKNRQAIIDNEIALLERNKGEGIVMQDSVSKKTKTIVIEYQDEDDDCEFFGIGCDYWDWEWDGHRKYDRRINICCPICWCC